MKRHTLILFFIWIFFNSSCQSIRCDRLIMEYRQNHDYKILNTDTFCHAMEIAIKSKELYLILGGDPDQWDQCILANYRKRGINVHFSGDVREEYSDDKDEGFNFIMRKRLRAKGKNLTNIELINSKQWYVDWSLISMLQEKITVKEDIKTLSLLIKLNDNLDKFKGVKFEDPIGKNIFSYSDLKRGIKIKANSNGNGYLNLDFSTATDPYFCKTQNRIKWGIPIKKKKINTGANTRS